MYIKQEAYEIHKTVVDANGNLTIDPSGYPKSVRSTAYDNDIEKTLKRAKGLLADIESEMSKQDTRQIQYGYIIRVSDGLQIEKRLFGTLPDVEIPDPPKPDPDPSPSPTPGPDEGGEDEPDSGDDEPEGDEEEPDGGDVEPDPQPESEGGDGE